MLTLTNHEIYWSIIPPAYSTWPNIFRFSSTPDQIFNIIHEDRTQELSSPHTQFHLFELLPRTNLLRGLNNRYSLTISDAHLITNPHPILSASRPWIKERTSKLIRNCLKFKTVVSSSLLGINKRKNYCLRKTDSAMNIDHAENRTMYRGKLARGCKLLHATALLPSTSPAHFHTTAELCIGENWHVVVNCFSWMDSVL
jgi:hypothetical protein